MTTQLARLARSGVAHQRAAPTLMLDRVSLSYEREGRTAFAVEDVTLSVEAGERLALVGPNGAGKSTLLKLIAGTLKPTSGKISIFGHGPDGHICIAYVPQRSQIDWSFPATVADVVMMGRVGKIGLFRWPRRRDWDVVRASLERVRAIHLRDRQIGALSGGQQQRVFIARALAQEAELLLLDEPLSGLDVPSREAIFEILDTLRPDGVTVLLATHDLNLAGERFDRVLLMNGRMIADGPGAEVLTPEALLRAYGGHLRVIDDESGQLVVADTCCDHGAD